MYFLRRPGQVLWLGTYRLELLSTGRKFTRWQITLPCNVPLYKGTKLVSFGRRYAVSYFHLDPHEAVWLSDIAYIRLMWCSARQVSIYIEASAEMRVLRGELLASTTVPLVATIDTAP